MEDLRVLSVNVGTAEVFGRDGKSFASGINKRPVPSEVFVSTTGLAGDTVCDSEHHGGADQAVYVYSSGDYAWWMEQLKRRIEPGTFGENLTIAGLPGDMTVGDRLLIGNLILEVTAPRIPCATLAAVMHDNRFPVQFRYAERPGFYFRVLNEGEVAAGDAVTIVENPQDAVSILELFRLAYDKDPAPALLRRALESPIAERMRVKLEARLASAEA